MQRSKGVCLCGISNNPNNGVFTIINNSEKTFSNVSIYDITGKVVYQGQLTNKEAKELDVKNLDNGIYLLLIENEKFKLVISK